MSDSYKYLDPQRKYTDKNGVLLNLLGITDEKILLFIESGIVTKKLHQLYKNPIKIHTVEELFKIHEYLFGEIYAWAGKKRTVEISKDGKKFFPTSHFETAFQYLNFLISEYKKTDEINIEKLAEKLAEILDHINYLHPFREGNGRAQREFVRVLALEKGFKLNLNPPNDATIYNRYMKGTIESNIQILTQLILELITK